jgi:hypothetical protein
MGIPVPRGPVSVGAVCWLLLGAAAFLQAQPAPSPDASQGAVPALEPDSDGNGNGSPEPSGEQPGEPATAAGGTESAGARRNENVFVSRIDNNAVRDVLVRLGASITMITDPGVTSNYYAAEFGRAPDEFPFLRNRTLAAWHGELYETHQNSIFNARTFFQVGSVRPSRQNAYGFQVGGPLGGKHALSLEGAQRKVRGMVNGNVLVPKADERQPRTLEPVTRTLVERFLAAYRDELPNRPDIDPRALNTNSPQSIDHDRLLGRWDLGLTGSRRLGLQYQYQNEFVDAFQLIAGQNPDTTLRSQNAQITLAQPWRGSGVWSSGAAFQRQKTMLASEPAAVGPFVRFGRAIESLGPKEFFPIDRIQNTYRAGTQFAWISGAHRWSSGAEFVRYQLNGSETFNHRGHFAFLDNFGRTAIENFLYGTPTSYKVAIGDPARGFRSLAFQAYLGDEWNVSPRWHLNLGLRYGLETAPTEVNGRTEVPYTCDCNNFSPRFGFAFQGGNWGVWRGAYTISYGQIIPATYQQARFNPPGIVSLEIANPNLVNPLLGIDVANLSAAGVRSSLLLLESTLKDPYSHQYTLNWERSLPRLGLLRLGYVGSRTYQLFFPLVTNRALPVPGVPLTTATINERRADSRYFEVIRVLNMARAYMDAAQVSLTYPWARGLSLNLSYTFGKALDTGADYTSTGSGEDIIFDSSQTEFEVIHDVKGPSRFDTKHAVLLQFSYDVPLHGRGPAARALLQGWNLSGAALVKTGTPVPIFVGSDAPGFGNVDGRSADRPNLLDPSILGRTIDHPDTSQQLLPRSAFAYIAPGEARGNLGRGTFRKDGINNLNLAVTKQWILPSRSAERRLLFRAEATNALNHPQFDEPGRSLVNPNFAQITNTLNDGRIFQLSLRLMF